MYRNPFVYGNPVNKDGFIGRKIALRRLISRILSHGQSTAIIGDPKIGKTSLLKYISSETNLKELYDDYAPNLCFSYIDAQALGSNIKQYKFWELALSSVLSKVENDNHDELYNQYVICSKNNFGTHTLENFFKYLKKENLMLVLLVDEFDVIIHIPTLNSAEFYGGMRSIASRSEGALSITIASRTPVSELNKITQEFNPTGSPFFNIFPEVTLGSFNLDEANSLLSIGENKFNNDDIVIISRVAGGHPYLLQAAAFAMWEAIEEEIEGVQPKSEYILKSLYRQIDYHFSDTWNSWTPEIRKAFTAVAMIHNVKILENRQFNVSAFINELNDLGPELNILEERGLITPNYEEDCKWKISSEIMLTWLADELVKTVRDPKSFDQWLRDEQIDGILTKREKKAFETAIRNTSDFLKHGALTIIEAMCKSFADSLFK